MFSRKDRFLHQEPNKIGFEFFWFFYDFLWIFEVAAQTLIHIYRRTLILFSRNYTEVPGLRKYPWNDLHPCNVALGGPGDLAGGDWPPELAGRRPWGIARTYLGGLEVEVEVRSMRAGTAPVAAGDGAEAVFSPRLAARRRRPRAA
jgi:hypothetical protein